MNRYKTGLFGYQGEFFKIKDFFDFVHLGESRGDLIDTVYLNPPMEVSVQGNIYLISEYKDYIISEIISSNKFKAKHTRKRIALGSWLRLYARRCAILP